MIPLIAAGFVLTAAIAFAILLWLYPVQVAIVVMIFVVVLDSLSITVVEINLGVSIYQDDVAGLAMILAVAIIAFRSRSLPKSLCGPAMLLLGLAGFDFFRGVLTFGPRPAGNGVRSLVFLVLPVLAGSALAPVLRMTFSRASVWLCGAAWSFTAISVARWASILPMPEVEANEDFRQIPRVLASDYPMVIGLALIAVIGWQLSRGARLSGIFKAVLFGSVVIVSQHRSVWVATAAGLVWLVFCSMRYTSFKRLVQFAVAGTAAAVVVSIIIVASGHTTLITSMLKDNVEETKQNDSTLAWRISGFDEAIGRTFSGGVAEIVIGPPAGRDLADVASFAASHIHSRYIDTLAYYGVAGLFLLLAWFVATAARISRLKSDPLAPAGIATAKPTLQAVFIAELVYFTAYPGNILHGALLGLIWLAAAEVDVPQARASHRQAQVSSPMTADPVFT